MTISDEKHVDKLLLSLKYIYVLHIADEKLCESSLYILSLHSGFLNMRSKFCFFDVKTKIMWLSLFVGILFVGIDGSFNHKHK